MIVKTIDQAKMVFNAIAEAHQFERVELCQQGNDCSLKFFRSKEWLDDYIEQCIAIGADLPDRELAEANGCILYIVEQRNSLGFPQKRLWWYNCKDTAENDAVWLVLWNHLLHAAKLHDIYIGDNLTSEVLVAKAGSTEERILIELDLAGFKVELDT